MMTFNIITTGAYAHIDNLTICKAIMSDQGIKFTEEVNRIEVIKRSMGMMNPSNGFIMISPTGEVLMNYIQLFRYLELKGLVRL